jgi:hypothetical protein
MVGQIDLAGELSGKNCLAVAFSERRLARQRERHDCRKREAIGRSVLRLPEQPNPLPARERER